MYPVNILRLGLQKGAHHLRLTGTVSSLLKISYNFNKASLCFMVVKLCIYNKLHTLIITQLLVSDLLLQHNQSFTQLSQLFLFTFAHHHLILFKLLAIEETPKFLKTTFLFLQNFIALFDYEIPVKSQCCHFFYDFLKLRLFYSQFCILPHLLCFTTSIGYLFNQGAVLLYSTTKMSYLSIS